MQRIIFGLVPGIMLLPALASVSLGQATTPEHAGRVSVTIVLSNLLPQDSRFVVQRMPAAAQKDRIVLRTDATTEDLMAAVNTLIAARQIEGDVPPVERTVRINPTRATRRRPYPWIGRLLSEIRQTGPSDVPGIGHARAMQIWLPAQDRAGRPRAKPRQ